MKNGDILLLYETLSRITSNPELKFNIRIGYIMARNKEKIRAEAVIISNQRRQIILEYGTLKDDELIVPKDKIDEVNQKINELMEIESDIQITTIPINEFDDNNKLNITDIEGLMPMLYQPIMTGPPIINN